MLHVNEYIIAGGQICALFCATLMKKGYCECYLRIDLLDDLSVFVFFPPISDSTFSAGIGPMLITGIGSVQSSVVSNYVYMHTTGLILV